VTYYIQRKKGHQLETVDEFTNKREAVRMRAEYQLSDLVATYYVSTRCCKNWRD
jgi:hypothetical protein